MPGIFILGLAVHPPIGAAIAGSKNILGFKKGIWLRMKNQGSVIYIVCRLVKKPIASTI